MAVCARCSAEHPDSTRFCGQCGARLDAHSPASLIATEASNFSRAATAARLSKPISSSTDSSEDGRFVPGTLLGDRYRIVSRLGAGGMGEVYRATDLRLGQPVALKFLPEEMAQDPKALARFHNEIRIARQVAHPNVCRVYDLGEVEGFPYLSMEYVDGEDLHSLLRRIGRLPADKAVEIARKLCAGLAAAHDKGVLHRDLKPANIMIDGRGHVLITDFGLAGVVGQIEGLETRNGTPGYMAPEQLTGKEVSVASDIYALGVVLYEMFTGKRPFNASTRAELIEKEEEGMPPAPRTVVKDIDPAVESVILRCLDPDPRKRPQSALAVLGALPGGDPLAAALAAGETPSPEMVAAAGTSAGLKPQRGIAWLAGILFTIAVLALLDQRCELISKIPFEQPPEVLAAKAREILGQIGYPEPPVSQAYGFDYRIAPLRYLVSLPKPLGPRLAIGRPAVVRFWYRTSPAPLAPHEISDVIRVRYTDPPNIVPGMVSMQLDPQGRLWYLLAVPPELGDAPGAQSPPDWGVLFRAAGLDVGRFHPDALKWTPPVEADARAAWAGGFAEAPEIPLHIEAAAFQGKPVFFFIAGPWSTASTPVEASGDDKPPGEVVYIILQLIVIIGSIPLARYNVKLGRGDTRGAMRLGLFCAAIGIASWAIGGTHVPSVKEADLFFMAFMRALIGAVSVAVTYISFEPFVRRRWPQTLISWSRMLAGGLRDPLVGRDVLVGTAMGLTLALIQAFGNLAYGWTMGESVRLGIRQAVLSGGRNLVGETLFQVNDSLYKGLGILFLIFLARAVLRSEWLAAGLVTLALAGITAPSQPNPLIGWPVEILFFSLMVTTVMRRGLLSMIVALFVTTFVGFFPLIADLSVWYASETLFTVGVVIAIAVYGLRTALAGQRLLAET